jgi:serine/threonine-protein kinase
VSKGTELLKVPDVVGKKKTDAEKAITDAGFKVKVTEEFSDTTPAGTVISQNPDGGVSIDAGSTVAIVVSKGANLVKVPDVTSMTEADAIAQLEDLGLVANVVYQVSPDVGIVINQDPLPTTMVAKGSTVKIYVGKAP